MCRENNLNIVFVCKRYYTGKDVVSHRFGRLYEIPKQLALLGHHVTVLCMDYRNSDPQEGFVDRFENGGACWNVIPLRNLLNIKIIAILQRVEASRPDIVMGSSDIPCLWVAKKLASRMKVPYVADLYDNYESFGQARIPGFRRILRGCIKRADVVIAVSRVLQAKVSHEREPQMPIVVMTNGILRSSFFIGDKISARVNLGLPMGVKLIGTAGNLSRMKGLDTVYEAWRQIEMLADNVFLVLAGRIEKKFPVPRGPRVIYLGELSEQQVGQLFRALDVGIIPAHDSVFGRYCFPQKLYEMVGSGLPVVAARVGAIGEILHQTPELLFTAGDSKSLLAATLLQIEQQKLTEIEIMEWAGLVADLEPVLLGLKNKAEDFVSN
jgi:teichuronic acid biosynthesis glycosyltransferase TuaC